MPAAGTRRADNIEVGDIIVAFGYTKVIEIIELPNIGEVVFKLSGTDGKKVQKAFGRNEYVRLGPPHWVETD